MVKKKSNIEPEIEISNESKQQDKIYQGRGGHPNPNFQYPEGYDESKRDYPEWNKKAIYTVQKQINDIWGPTVSVDGKLGDSTMRWLNTIDPDLANNLAASDWFQKNYKGEDWIKFDKN